MCVYKRPLELITHSDICAVYKWDAVICLRVLCWASSRICNEFLAYPRGVISFCKVFTTEIFLAHCLFASFRLFMYLFQLSTYLRLHRPSSSVNKYQLLLTSSSILKFTYKKITSESKNLSNWKYDFYFQRYLMGNNLSFMSVHV